VLLPLLVLALPKPSLTAINVARGNGTTLLTELTATAPEGARAMLVLSSSCTPDDATAAVQVQSIQKRRPRHAIPF